MTDTDAGLAGRARSGDRGAFEELVRRTARLVYARLYLDTGRADRAEDLLQDTYLRAFRSVAGLADPAGFRPWLLAVARTVLLDDARRAARRKRLAPVPAEVPVAALVDDGPGPDADAEREELRGRVLAVLRSLPDEYRLPITLRYIAGAETDDIGAQLGLTNGAVRGRLHRGLKLLRDRLPPDLIPE